MALLKGAQPETSKRFPIRAAPARAGGQTPREGFLGLHPAVQSRPGCKGSASSSTPRACQAPGLCLPLRSHCWGRGAHWGLPNATSLTAGPPLSLALLTCKERRLHHLQGVMEKLLVGGGLPTLVEGQAGQGICLEASLACQAHRSYLVWMCLRGGWGPVEIMQYWRASEPPGKLAGDGGNAVGRGVSVFGQLSR